MKIILVGTVLVVGFAGAGLWNRASHSSVSIQPPPISVAPPMESIRAVESTASTIATEGTQSPMPNLRSEPLDTETKSVMPTLCETQAQPELPVSPSNDSAPPQSEQSANEEAAPGYPTDVPINLPGAGFVKVLFDVAESYSPPKSSNSDNAATRVSP